MEDTRIVNLYWARSENAIAETSAKYGSYCYSIAYNILANAEDADESVNDTYLDAWNSTVLQNFPLFCPKCKQETLISVKELNTSVIKEPDA